MKLRSRLCIALVIICCCAAFAQHYRTATEALADGIRLYEQEKPEESLRALDAAANLSRKPIPNVFHYRCMANYLLHRYEPALKNCQALIDLQPANDLAWSNAGLIYQALGQDERAIEDLSRAVTINPKNIRALRNRGVSNEHLGHLQEAISDYTTVLQSEPGNTDVLLLRASAFNRVQDYDRAEGDASSLISLDKTKESAFVIRGEARQALGKCYSAIDDFSQGISLNPDWAWPLAKRCECNRSQKKLDSAIADCNRAIEKVPNATYFYLDRAEVFLDLQRYQEALEDLREAIQYDHKDARAYYLQGRVNEAQGLWSVAIVDYDEALHLDDSRPLFFLHRGLVRLLNGDLQGYREDIASAYRLAESSPKASLLIEADMFSAAVTLGDLDAGIRLLNTVRDSYPDSVETLLNLTVLYRLKKDYVGAGKLIDAVLEKSPGLPSALEQEAFLREAQAKPSDAVTILKRILVSTQKATYSRTESDFRSETMVNLALALNWLGKHDEAIQIWDELAAFSPKQAPLAAREKAFLLLAGGQKAQALTTLEGQLRSSPDDADLVISHAFLLLNSDRSDNAATELNDYVKRQPGFRAWLAVAAVEERRKDFTGALAALAAAEKFVRSLDQLRTVNEYRAMFFDQNQQVDSAEAEYRQIVLREPNNSDALNSLGYFFAQHRIKLDEAEQLLKRALIMNPMNANYQDSLGNL